MCRETKREPAWVAAIRLAMLEYYVSTPGMGTLADTKISEKNLTTVPKPVRNFLEVGAGDRVEWHVEDGRIIVEKHDIE